MAADQFMQMIDPNVTELSLLQQARKLLAGIGQPQEAASIAKKAARLIRQAEDRLKRPSSLTRPAKRGMATVAYVVEVTALGENIAEYRPGTAAKPFRCPKALYDAMTEVLAEVSTPLALREIIRRVEHRIGHKTGAHQTGVPIRLWRHVQPPLLVRDRGLYGPVDPTRFTSACRELWVSLLRR